MAKSNFTMVETPTTSTESKITVRPYFDARSENMGLEDYGLSLFDGVKHQEQLACLEINGINRYLTGLNEFAPEIKKLNPELREAKVKQIRAAVGYYEAYRDEIDFQINRNESWSKEALFKRYPFLSKEQT